MTPENVEEYDQIKWEDLLKEKRLDLILTRDQLVAIIRQLGHKIDDEGYVLDRETGERVLSIDGGEIKADDVAAALPGSEVLIRKNIASFSQYLAERGL
ncbi:MAG TPA: hypothetical protein VF944_03230 [Candidatus Bathyarchaeia archaeon]